MPGRVRHSAGKLLQSPGRMALRRGRRKHRRGKPMWIRYHVRGVAQRGSRHAATGNRLPGRVARIGNGLTTALRTYPFPRNRTFVVTPSGVVSHPHDLGNKPATDDCAKDFWCSPKLFSALQEHFSALSKRFRGLQKDFLSLSKQFCGPTKVFLDRKSVV